MAHHHHHPYQLQQSHYPQLQRGYAAADGGYAPQVFAPQAYSGVGAVGATTSAPSSEGRPEDDLTFHPSQSTVSTSTQRASTAPIASRRPLAPTTPTTGTTSHVISSSTSDDALHPLLTSRPLPLAPPPLSGSSTHTTASATSRIAALAGVREQAVGQFIAMELRREKERKRKADWRARKRAEAAHAEGGGGGDDPGTGLSEEGRIGEEGTMGEEQDVHRASVEESSSERCAKLRHSTEASTIIATPTPTPAQHYHHHHQQQQNVIDPQLIGQGETSYSSGSGLGSSGKVQVKVGNRYVAFEIEQVEKLIREQQAQQQAQQQAAEQEQAGGSHSTPQSQSNDPHSHRQIQSSTANSGGTSTATEDDSLTLEALMASASRDVPLPSTLHEVMQDDAGHMLDLADDNHSQTDGEHDMSSITLNTANGLGASYASLSSLSSLIGPSGSLPQMHGMSSTAVRNASPSASSTVNTNMTRQTRQLTNWFQPILWTMIDETAEKFGFNKAATIARHLKTTVSPRLFERLGERQVRKWINNEKTGWRDTVLEKVTRQEVLAHVQAGLITVPSGNGSINVSGPPVSAFGARARGGTTAGAIPREPTKRNGSEAPNHSQHHVEDHDTLDSVDDHALADIREEDGRRKRRRLREEGTSIDQPTEDLHLPLRSDLHSGIAMDPSLLGH